jgi:Xaa-Pro aminopeptidase
MLTMHPTLLTGPADWQPDRMPRQEFLRRIDALWGCDPEAEQAIVYGTSHRHAELAYVTNITPKLEAVAALLSRSGEQRLFVGGGVNMLAAAQPLTWITKLSPLRDLIDALRPSGSLRRSLIVGADAMPLAFRRNLMEATGGGDAVQDATDHVRMLMRRKSSREVAAIREAVAAMRHAGTGMLEAFKAGAGVSEVISAGELAANAAGAQDVRTLFSLDGGRTFEPFVAPIPHRVDPLMTYLAVRRFNYWAESFPFLTAQAQTSAPFEKAREALGSAVAAVRAGTPASEIETLIISSLQPYRLHPLTAHAFARRIGLALEEPPATNPAAAFEEGEVYSLRIGATDADRQHVICSKMILVRKSGNEFLL